LVCPIIAPTFVSSAVLGFVALAFGLDAATVAASVAATVAAACSSSSSASSIQILRRCYLSSNPRRRIDFSP
jgi:hypothetical protein